MYAHFLRFVKYRLGLVGSCAAWPFALLLLLLILPLGSRAYTPALADALNPDGTLRADARGSFNSEGYRLSTGPNGQPAFARIAASPPDWQDGFNLYGANGLVNAVLCRGTNVYIGGSFTAVGNTVANNIARWDGSNWHALGSGVGDGGGGGPRNVSRSGSWFLITTDCSTPADFFCLPAGSELRTWLAGMARPGA